MMISQFQDKPFKRVHGLKYLGFLISKDGSWDSHLEMLIKRAISRLAISYDFFNAEFISFEVKIHAARAMIISMLSYGQDIIYLNES